jgi:hypothetical protein
VEEIKIVVGVVGEKFKLGRKLRVDTGNLLECGLAKFDQRRDDQFVETGFTLLIVEFDGNSTARTTGFHFFDSSLFVSQSLVPAHGKELSIEGALMEDGLFVLGNLISVYFWKK